MLTHALCPSERRARITRARGRSLAEKYAEQGTLTFDDFMYLTEGTDTDFKAFLDRRAAAPPRSNGGTRALSAVRSSPAVRSRSHATAVC